MRGPNYGVSAQFSPTVALDPCDSRTADALEQQQRVTSYPYYSTVKYTATRTANEDGSYVWGMPVGGERRAFAYGLRETKEAAGYAVADGVATRADTNIVTKNQTISGQYVQIFGLALQWHTTALNAEGDPSVIVSRDFAAAYISALMRIISVRLSVNGDDNTYKLGTIGMVPGAGGLVGGGPFQTGLPFLDGPQQLNFAANGWQTRSNFLPIPEGVWWNTSDKPDGNFNLVFTTEEVLNLYSGGSPENNAFGVDQAAIPNVSAGYAYPEFLVAELKVILIGTVYGGRTRTA